MDLLKGTRLGPYEIVELVGKGGMGEVYRAFDTRLDRTVAIKVLLEQDAQRQQRFTREAKAVSSLNHPHICTLYDVGEENGTHFLVMEFLAGETLAERMQKGRLPLPQSLEFAVQIADALDKAHRQGIVHRDLKPGNIMITKSGVKLLDFGLAKQKGQSAPAFELSAIPTRESTPLTQEGTILGTLQYMAPEQLDGEEADSRADIFAFGAILYEMVTGRRAFEAKSQASLIGAIMNSDPKPMSQIDGMTPTALDHLVHTCLAKDPDNRWQSAADVRRELLWIGQSAKADVPGSPHARQPIRLRQAALWTLVGMVASGAIASVVMWTIAQPGEPQRRVLRQFAIAPATSLLRNAGSLLGISPDGQTLVYVGFPENGGRQLYRHLMDQVEDTPIPGTEWGGTTTAGQSSAPFFSPDGKWVAFQALTALKKVPVAGGPTVTLAEGGFFRGGSWGADDVIVLGGGRSGLLRISSNGGVPTAILAPKPSEGEFLYPQLLAGGEAILFTVSPDRLTGHLEVLMLKSGKRRTLLEGVAGHVVPSGHLVFFRAGSLWAVRFDTSRLVTTGDAVPVVERVRSEIEGAFQYAVSDDGSLAYIPEPASALDRTLVWVDQNGQEQPTKVPPAGYTWARVSPDGKRAAVQIGDVEDSDVGVVDIESGLLNRLTNQGRVNAFPLWAPDGESIVFASDREGPVGLFSTTPDGTGPVKRLALFPDALRVQPHSWSADGTQLVFFYISYVRGIGDSAARGVVDIGVLRADGTSAPAPLLNTPNVEQTPAVSPDGKWIAYSSNETGQEEIYVQRFPELGQKRPVTTGGGLDPMWAPDGTRLYYHAAPPTKMMMVPIDTRSTVISVGAPQVLFERQYYRPVPGTRTHSISADGTRLLMIKAGNPSNAANRIHIVVNWFDELQRLLPSKN